MFSFNFMPANITTSQKVVMFSVTTGVALLGILASYLSRRKVRPVRHARLRAYGGGGGRRTRNSIRSPNDAMSTAGSRASARSVSPGGSIYTTTDVLSYASGSTHGGGGIGGGGAPLQHSSVPLTPQQLGVMGMERLDDVINIWEDALAAHSLGNNAPSHAEDAEFFREIQSLLEIAYGLQEQSELLFLDERSCLFRTNADETQQDAALDSAESFASALDQIADLREFEDFEPADEEEAATHPLYLSTLRGMEHNAIPCRLVRSELVHVASESEYLAKLHCIRLAFHHMFRDASVATWVADTGRQILTDLLCLGDKDPKDFIICYERMLAFVREPLGWQQTELELGERGVKAMTFFDIVLDFIILDAFKDLECPPGSVMAVVNNRFLSNGFKETALGTAVWSVLRTKKRMLKFSDGFMAYFYQLSEQISPLMCWGFFGNDENLRDVCHYFRGQIVDFIADIFNFQKVRYTRVEELSEDILKLMRERASNIQIRFSA